MKDDDQGRFFSRSYSFIDICIYKRSNQKLSTCVIGEVVKLPEMHCSKVLRAQLSQTVYHTKKAFDKRLDSVPTTAFHYYYQTKIKEMQTYSGPSSSRDQLNFAHYNNGFKRYIRKEWSLLSGTRRRLYYAFFFHFTKIDHTTLNECELARIMEISTPAISEYMLFRNKYKSKFDTIWSEQEATVQSKKTPGTRRNAKISDESMKVTLSNTQRDHLLSLSVDNTRDDIKNLTKRFREMCRECRTAWETCISDGRKLEIKKKWQEQKRRFELQLQYERRILDYNLNKLSQIDFRCNSLCVELPVTHTLVDTKSMDVLRLASHKKK